MKRCLRLSVVGLLTFVVIGWSHATPLYYTFNGLTTGAAWDGAGIVAIDGGNAISYTFLVDFEASAFQLLNNDIRVYMNDYTDSSLQQYDYFFADYIAGSILCPINGGYFFSPNSVKEYNYGVNETNQNDPSRERGILAGGSDNSVLYILSTNIVLDWMIGDQFTGRNHAYDPSRNRYEGEPRGILKVLKKNQIRSCHSCCCENQ